MSESMRKKVTEYHDKLATALMPHQGEVLTLAQVRAIWCSAYPMDADDAQWIMATDHARNHTNGGPCDCSRTGDALFDYVGRNQHRVR